MRHMHALRTAATAIGVAACLLVGAAGPARAGVAQDQPVDAVDDFGRFFTGLTLDIRVLRNDLPEGQLDPASVRIVSAPSPGTATVSEDGTIFYTSPLGFLGLDSLSYEVCGLDGSCDTAVVTVEVTPRSVAIADVATTTPGAPVTIDVLANDLLLVQVIGFGSFPPGHGTTQVTTDDRVLYTPDPGFVGIDSFEYSLCDFTEMCSRATVTVTVAEPAPPAPAPAAPESEVPPPTSRRGPAARPQLPATGTHTVPLTTLGAGLVVIGALMVTRAGRPATGGRGLGLRRLIGPTR